MQTTNWSEEGFDKFTFRAHYIGYLMSKAKGKSNLEKWNELNEKITEGNKKYAGMKPELKSSQNFLDNIYDMGQERDKIESYKHVPHLSESCKTKLAEIYTAATTERKKDVKSKFMEKGLLLEEDAITQYSLLTGKMYRKNTVRLNNGMVEGEFDIEDEDTDTILDTKVCWDIFTFDAKVSKRFDPVYEWQGDTYMWLRNRKNFRLIYSLLNTPAYLVKREELKLMYEFFGSESNYQDSSEELKGLYNEALIQINKNHLYDDLPLQRKIRVYETIRSEERIEQLKSAIPHWRNYLNNFGKSVDTYSETE
jgi:hypothetical protein